MQKFEYDIKGFVNSSKTPDTDKALFKRKYDEAIVLLDKGLHFLTENYNTVVLDPDTNYHQSASGSTLPRGFYCPSPIWDVVVGNKKRGRLLIRESQRSNVSHRYVFSKDSALLRVEMLYSGQVFATEYIKQYGEITYGFTIDTSGRIYAVSKELYHDGTLEQYTVVYYLFINSTYSVLNTHCESYWRDELGLHTCEIVICEHAVGHIDRKVYRFERNDGYLDSYYVIEDDKIVSPKYTVQPRRKA